MIKNEIVTIVGMGGNLTNIGLYVTIATGCITCRVPQAVPEGTDLESVNLENVDYVCNLFCKAED